MTSDAPIPQDNDMAQAQADEERQRANGLSYETPFYHGPLWTDMSVSDIEDFLRWHPTYCMTSRQASDWWAGVEHGIRRSLEGKDRPATYAKHFIAYGDDQQPIFEAVRLT